MSSESHTLTRPHEHGVRDAVLAHLVEEVLGHAQRLVDLLLAPVVEGEAVVLRVYVWALVDM